LYRREETAAGDTHTAVIDWGDGTVTAGIVDQVAGSVSGAHTYQTLGLYLVTVTPYQLYLPVSLNNQ